MLTTRAEQLIQQHQRRFIRDCAERGAGLTAFIGELLQGRHNESFGQAVALIMEYEYQDFSVYGWLRGANGGHLGDKIIEFPEECLPKFDTDIEDEIYDLGQDENGEDEVSEAADHFYGGLHEYFRGWFADCFRTAAQNSGSTLPAYFSVHDTNSYTNLATLREERSDHIAQKFGWPSFWPD